VLRRSVMVSQHVVCLWKNAIRMCNKKHIFGTLRIGWRVIVYVWLNIDILCIKTVLDYYDFLVYMYNTHPD